MFQLVAAGLALAAMFGQDVRHHHRRHHHPPPPPMSYAVASWYYDAGNTASGYHSYYGVANKYLPFGTKVRFAYRGRRVTAVVDDRGPYISGRTWDLNQNVARDLGFSGVAVVGYHIGG